jgi:hypothetical protein
MKIAECRKPNFSSDMNTDNNELTAIMAASRLTAVGNR